MKDKDIHFLDTNILLAMVLPNDPTYDYTKKYLQYSCYRYISNTACLESEDKINKIRRISLKITDYVMNYSLNHQINLLSVDDYLPKIRMEFLNQYGDNPFPENLKKERFISLVSNFFNEYDEELRNILISENNDKLNDIIISSFRISIDLLDVFLKEYNCITFIQNVDKCNSLRNIGVDKKDAVLLEESYCLHLLLNEVIFFITFDGGILKLSNQIKEILSLNVTPTNPSSFT